MRAVVNEIKVMYDQIIQDIRTRRIELIHAFQATVLDVSIFIVEYSIICNLKEGVFTSAHFLPSGHVEGHSKKVLWIHETFMFCTFAVIHYNLTALQTFIQ